ncbi:hypothetical protein R3W88_004623 [Solanum pinnatisectum]|uniref:Uncharacterized protein n=1 Tax=Solanum pinnatisectum TaxID=50273 RepID=A0AAV9K9S7_9SOLN|nr:hypothetical protein R3W88_004623 [Solanum pinnatisectum]
MEWVLGNGSSTSFWLDRWLPKDRTIRDMIHGPLSMKESTMTVDDIVTNNGIWDLGKHLSNYLKRS